MVGTFEEHLSAAFPSQINVDVTEFCNLACVHCPYEDITKLKGRGRRNLPMDWHRRLIDEIVAHGREHCRFIRYTGDGEPLLHPNLAEMLAEAIGRTGVQVNLTTNGMLLTEDRARVLIDAGVSVFDVSIDAHSLDVYAQVRVGGDLTVTRENTLRLIRMARETNGRSRVMVSFVRQPLNLHEADAFEREWRAAGADFVVLRNQHSCAGSMPDVARDMWARAPAQRKPCLYPWERLTLKVNGQLTYCPVDWRHEGEIGHITETSIRTAWQGETMKALRAAHISGDFSAHGFCGRCPDWSVTRWPSEGRSYASVMHEFAAAVPDERATS
jgi:pyruvate-formate lyase-activating enzyme